MFSLSIVVLVFLDRVLLKVVNGVRVMEGSLLLYDLFKFVVLDIWQYCLQARSQNC